MEGLPSSISTSYALGVRPPGLDVGGVHREEPGPYGEGGHRERHVCDGSGRACPATTFD